MQKFYKIILKINNKERTFLKSCGTMNAYSKVMGRVLTEFLRDIKFNSKIFTVEYSISLITETEYNREI